jgi:hypothetical protein
MSLATILVLALLLSSLWWFWYCGVPVINNDRSTLLPLSLFHLKAIIFKLWQPRSLCLSIYPLSQSLSGLVWVDNCSTLPV